MSTRRVLQAIGDPSHEGGSRFAKPSHRINAEGEEGDLLLLTCIAVVVLFFFLILLFSYNERQVIRGPFY